MSQLRTSAVFALAVALLASAQIAFAPHHPATNEAKRLAVVLNLTPEQQERVHLVLSQERREFSQDGITGGQGRSAAMAAARSHALTRIRALLSRGQAAQFDDFLKKLDAERKARRRR